jgi:chromosome segregation protein
LTIIKKINLKGFKSFAKPVEIIFGSGFNCCLGPNGSGKSNIMDAMCFVLGKTSAKSLRAEKSANLIYNGGKKGTPAKEAECSIVFDNSKKSFPVEKDEIVITRKVKHSGNSVYKINDEVVTRLQVIDLLRAANIEPDGHNIMLQGDIVHFMEMKPEERRELVEEISGISVWEDKKHKAILDLQSVDERLKEASIMLAERETYLKELRKDRDQALKYKELEANARDNKATWLHLQINDKEGKKQEVESRINKQQQELNKSNQKITELNSFITQKQEEIKKLEEEMDLKGDEERKKLSQEMLDLKEGIARDQERLNTCNNEIKKLAQQIPQLRKGMQDHDQKIDELDLQREDLNRKIKDLTDEEKKIQTEINSFKTKYGIKDESFDTVDKLEKEIEKKQEELLKEQGEKQNLVNQKAALELQIKTAEDKIKEILNLKKEDQEKLNRLKEKRVDFSKAVKDLSTREEKDSEYSSKLTNSRKDLAKVSEELAKLSIRQTNQRDFTTSDIAVKKVLEMGKGVHGIVSDLGEVDPKYSMALDIAAGPRTKSIVVDTDETAAKCINYLKESKLGVVTFLPLNKIRPTSVNPSIREILTKKGVIDLAVNLVSYDPKFKDVFSYVFGNTVIVQDINTARKIGIGSARMVTLEGDLIDQTGAMTGGHRWRKAGVFKEKELNTSILKLTQEETSLKKQSTDLESLKLENENFMWKLKERKVVLEAEITGLENSIGVSQDLKEFEKNKETMTGQIKTILESVKQSQAKTDSYYKEVEQMKQQRNSLREKLKHPEIAEGMKQFDERRQKTSLGMIESRTEIKRINDMIELHHKAEIQKIKEIITGHEKEQKAFEEEIKKLVEVLKTKGSTFKNKEVAERKFHVEFRSLYGKKTKLIEYKQKQENNLIREEETVKAVQERVNRFNLDRAKVESELAGLNEQFKEYADSKIRRGVEIADLEYEMRKFDRLMKEMGNVNMRALEVYEEIENKYKEVLGKKDKLKVEKEDVLIFMKEIDGKKQYNFMKTFKTLQQNFKDSFAQISTKGEAFLELENKENVFEGGVDIKVKIVGNRYLDIKSLSGGEKTLAALAFIFAIQEFNPASFYLMDEVDAALDKRNSELLSKLIKKYSDKAQYIVISHNDQIITEADQIYGISMQDGVSKIISLKI